MKKWTVTDEVQPTDGDWSGPGLQPDGHWGFQLELPQTHLRRRSQMLRHISYHLCVAHSHACRRTSLHRTMGRQLMWRCAMGTEVVFPWWFMAVTSTTLLSSLAPSPRQTWRSHSSCFRKPHCHHMSEMIIQKLWFHVLGCLVHVPCCNCTYCSEFKEVLQVLLLISLESVERKIGGQLAAWKTNPGTMFSVSCEKPHFLLVQKHAGCLFFLKKKYRSTSQRRSTCAPPEPSG